MCEYRSYILVSSMFGLSCFLVKSIKSSYFFSMFCMFGLLGLKLVISLILL